MNCWEYIEEVSLIISFLAVSAFCSAAETSYSAARPEILEKMRDEKKFGASRAVKLLGNFDSCLSSILIANTIVCVSLSSAGAVLFGDILGDDEYGAALSGAFMTVFILLFGEISPKLLAKESSEKMACALAYPLCIMTWVLAPFCYMISFWKLLLMKLFRPSSGK